MLYLTAETSILVAVEPVDFRKQIDGLIAVCEHHLEADPRSGTLFAFINRARSMIRVLCYDGTGYWLATKRLSRGRYVGWPNSSGFLCKMASSELNKIVKHLFALSAEAL